ncbi:MAG: hypothetical protein ACI9TV_000549 [Sulfurimonas sp.]|jgi:hypothetical protein|uniref:hypothetical protein n=1 Tax=Sulfurimonas sp. TaxID=2022749 RepID=UPI0039E3DFC0
MKFNFSGLSNIYNQSIEDNERTLAFQVNNGNGRFVFMMFFDEDDNTSKDTLFIFLRNINFLVKLKMYGSHKNGIFDVYFNEFVQNKFIEELQLEHNNGNFAFEDFLEIINSQIPNMFQRAERIQTIRDIWNVLDTDFKRDIIEEEDKTILKGIVRLPDDKNPREKTLRKLYIYIDAESSDISDLINMLKDRNITLSWTNNPDLEISFADALMQVN